MNNDDDLRSQSLGKYVKPTKGLIITTQTTASRV